jgi:hypothetical protein
LCRADGELLKPDAPSMPLDAFWLGSAFCGANSLSCSIPRPAQGELWATVTRIGSVVFPVVFAQLAVGFNEMLPKFFSHLKSVPSMHRDGNVASEEWQPPELGWVIDQEHRSIDSHQEVATNAALYCWFGIW